MRYFILGGFFGPSAIVLAFYAGTIHGNHSQAALLLLFLAIVPLALALSCAEMLGREHPKKSS